MDALYFDSVSTPVAISYHGNIQHLPSILEGEREIIRQLYERHPAVLFAGERCGEESVDLVPLWQARNSIWNALFSKYAYTFAHTVAPSSIPQRYSEVGGISQYSEEAQRQELELCRRQTHVIPRLMVNYRDRGLDELTMKCIEELISISS